MRITVIASLTPQSPVGKAESLKLVSLSSPWVWCHSIYWVVNRGFVCTVCAQLVIQSLGRRWINRTSCLSCTYKTVGLDGQLFFCFYIQFTLIVTCTRCNIISSHKCLIYTNQTFCTMSFNRKLINFCGTNISKLKGPFLFYFCVDVARVLELVPY